MNPVNALLHKLILRRTTLALRLNLLHRVTSYDLPFEIYVSPYLLKRCFDLHSISLHQRLLYLNFKLPELNDSVHNPAHLGDYTVLGWNAIFTWQPIR